MDFLKATIGKRYSAQLIPYQLSDRAKPSNHNSVAHRWTSQMMGKYLSLLIAHRNLWRDKLRKKQRFCKFVFLNVYSQKRSIDRHSFLGNTFSLLRQEEPKCPPSSIRRQIVWHLGQSPINLSPKFVSIVAGRLANHLSAERHPYL